VTTTKEYLESKKINGWVIDRKGRTDALPWRCWRIDSEHELNNRQMSFATKATQPGTHASRIGETYAPYGCSWRNSVDSCDSNGCGRVFLDCKDEATRKYIGEQMSRMPKSTLTEHEFI
jgi:hypothetical protein